jgi:hypothetical protein
VLGRLVPFDGQNEPYLNSTPAAIVPMGNPMKIDLKLVRDSNDVMAGNSPGQLQFGQLDPPYEAG